MSQLKFPEFIEQLIDKYLNTDNCGLCSDEAIRSYYAQLTIEQCIEEATNQGRFEINGQKKFDDHYKHFSPSNLEKSRKTLMRFVDDFKNCNTFVEVYNIVRNSHKQIIDNLADLYYYDTAFRIACTLELLPKDVFLHRGALYGAELLLRRIELPENQPYISRVVFERMSPAFKRLGSYQIESFLCVMDRELEKYMGKLDNFKTVYRPS